MSNNPILYNEADIESGKFHLAICPEIQSLLKNYDIILPVTYDYVEYKKFKAYQESYVVKDDNRHEQKFVFFHFYFTVLILFDFKNNTYKIDLMIAHKFPNNFSCTFTGNKAITEPIDKYIV